MDLEEIDKELGVDIDKVKKSAQYDIAPGGRLDMKQFDYGTPVDIQFLSEPRTVENPKLVGGKALMARVLHSGVEYDLVLTKTLWFGIRREMIRNGFSKLKGAKFVVVPRKWEDAPEEYKLDKGEVKTYVVQYKGTATAPSGASEEISEVRL